MVKRKIPKTELRRHIRDTPFTRDEVQTLWNRFNNMDLDGSGLLNYQVWHFSPFQLAPAVILYPNCIGHAWLGQTGISWL